MPTFGWFCASIYSQYDVWLTAVAGFNISLHTCVVVKPWKRSLSPCKAMKSLKNDTATPLLGNGSVMANRWSRIRYKICTVPGIPTVLIQWFQLIRSLLRPSDGDHEKSYRIVELFILITGLNICNLGLVSGWSRVVDPARASRGAKTDYDDRALEFLSFLMQFQKLTSAQHTQWLGSIHLYYNKLIV